MIVQRFQKMRRYNDWAWSHVIESVKQISEAEYKKKRPFFWGSIHGTLAHSLAAEIIWIERLSGNNPTVLLGADDFDSLNEIVDRWQTVQSQWRIYLENLTIEVAAGNVQYRSTEGELRVSGVADIIQQVLNHGTEHRSQLTPVLFELDAATTQLDFIFFCTLVEPG